MLRKILLLAVLASGLGGCELKSIEADYARLGSSHASTRAQLPLEARQARPAR